MPVDNDELLAAISGGVDAASPSKDNTDVNDEPDAGDLDTSADTSVDGDADTEGDASGDEGEVSGTDGDAGEEGTDEGDKGDEGEVDPKTGKPVAKAKEPEAQPEIDPATGKPFTPEQIKAKKEKEDFARLQVEDPINAPIPKYLKEATGKRMTKLVEIAKELTAKHEAASRDRNEIIGMITDTGATATQYTSALQYLKMVNSGDPELIKQAITVMQNELAALSRMAGIPVAGVDHLAAHPDLKQKVAEGKLDQQLAEEIAAGREHRTLQSSRSQATAQSQEQAQAEHKAGIAALNEVGRQLSKQPGYKAKAQAVLKSIEGELAKQHPSKWAQTFLVAYSTYAPQAAPTPPTPPRLAPKIPKNQPLRGNNPSGGQQTAPKSLEEAINLGIAAGTRK